MDKEISNLLEKLDKKISMLLVGIFLVLAAQIVSNILLLYHSLRVPSITSAIPSQGQQPKQQEFKIHPLDVDIFSYIDRSDPSFGDNDKIIILLFTDYECPFTASAIAGYPMKMRDSNYDPAVPYFIEEFSSKNKAKLVFIDFPLRFHKNARNYSYFVNCIYKVSPSASLAWKLIYNFELNRILKNFASSAQLVNESVVKSILCDNSVNPSCTQLVPNIVSCYNSSVGNEAIDKEIDADRILALKLQVRGTPGFAFMVSKSSITKDKIIAAIRTLYKLGVRDPVVYETKKYYVIVFSGAYPREVFSTFLNTLQV